MWMRKRRSTAQLRGGDYDDDIQFVNFPIAESKPESTSTQSRDSVNVVAETENIDEQTAAEIGVLG